MASNNLEHADDVMQIRNFVNDIQTELDKPGVNSFGLGDFKAPKVLGDILESIAGALFLDTLLDTEKVWEVSLEDNHLFSSCNYDHLVTFFWI